MEKSWENILQEEFKKKYYKKIQETLSTDKDSGEIIYPPESLIFNAFKYTPFDKIKVVILGQDPYHGL